MGKKEERLLRLWKLRQQKEGHDVSGVNSLEEAKHFFDKPAGGTKNQPQGEKKPRKAKKGE